MNRKLAQFLVFALTFIGSGWSLFAYHNYGKEYTTSVQLRKYFDEKPPGISFGLGGFVIWVIWEAAKKRENSNSGLTGFQFWLIVIPIYLLGHSLWGI